MAETICQRRNPAKTLRKEAAVASAKNALTREPAATAEGANHVNVEDEALGGTRDEGRARLRCLCGRVQRRVNKAWTCELNPTKSALGSVSNERQGLLEVDDPKSVPSYQLSGSVSSYAAYRQEQRSASKTPTSQARLHKHRDAVAEGNPEGNPSPSLSMTFPCG